MALLWTSTTLALVDDEHDKTYASDGYSRFGAYLTQHASDFEAWAPHALSPVEFATAVWRIATGPIMSPGYVRIRTDLNSITLGVADQDGSLHARIAVPLFHGDLTARLPYSFRDWERSSYRDHGYDEVVYPPDNKPSVLAVASVSVPVSNQILIAPTHVGGHRLVDEARQVVGLLASEINRAAGPVVQSLRTRTPRLVGAGRP